MTIIQVKNFASFFVHLNAVESQCGRWFKPRCYQYKSLVAYDEKCSRAPVNTSSQVVEIEVYQNSLLSRPLIGYDVTN